MVTLCIMLVHRVRRAEERERGLAGEAGADPWDQHAEVVVGGGRTRAAGGGLHRVLRLARQGYRGWPPFFCAGGQKVSPARRSAGRPQALCGRRVRARLGVCRCGQGHDAATAMPTATNYGHDPWPATVRRRPRPTATTTVGHGSVMATTHGHNHPRIMQAVRDQTERLDQLIFAGWTHEPAETLARGLVDMMPRGLDYVFYSDSGSTAVEVALKMALGYWHNRGEARHRVLVMEHSYHGDTIGAMSVGERGVFNRPYEALLFDVGTVPFPGSDPQPTFDALEAACAAGDAAAFIVEPLLLVLSISKGGDRVVAAAAEAAARAAENFREQRIPKFFRYFEDALSANDGPFVLGDRWSHVDTSLFQLVEGLRYAFPAAMTQHKHAMARIAALTERVAARPGIARYLDSARRIAFNEDGIFRHYPELDVAR